MTGVADHVSEPLSCPRWLHYWAVLTVCATLPLLLLGAEVTTKQVGMVDPVGFREPWHLLRDPERAWREIGYLIEHSHRLVGFVVGTCAMVLAVGLWVCQPRHWLGWVGLAALLGVSLQGVLGILRVDKNALMGRELALIHGCFAQLVFALLCALVLFTSRSWRTEASTTATDGEGAQLRRWTLLTAGLTYLQVILGGLVRHFHSPLGQRGHLLVAFAVVAAVAWLARLTFQSQAAHRPLTLSVVFLTILLVLQLFLGVEAWMIRFASGTLPELQSLTTGQEIVRTAHYLVGSWIFATAVIVGLRTYRRAGGVSPLLLPRQHGAHAPRSPKVSVPVGHMEEAV